MAFLFGRARGKSTTELVRSTQDLVSRLVAEEKLQPKSEEELTRNLASMRVVLQGTTETDCSPDQVHSLCTLLVKEDLLQILVENIHRLPFESRKDTQAIISNVFRFKQPGDTEPAALQYVISNRPGIIVALCHGYDRRESAMPCGGILKEALKHDAVTALILYHEPTTGDEKALDLAAIDTSKPASGRGVFWKFFDWIDKSLFENILVKHKAMVSRYMDTNFNLFFEKYNNMLIKSDSYVTKRQSIKLLGELLLDRQFYEIMTRYVESGENLKLIMWQLKDDRKMVQYEGFHVFKIFAANPNKSPEVRRLLMMNRQRLLDFLPNFLSDRQEDDQFNDEKSYLIKQIKLLPTSAGPNPGGDTNGHGPTT